MTATIPVIYIFFLLNLYRLKTKHRRATYNMSFRPDHVYKVSLANSSNKQAFLAEYMAKVNTTVQYAEGDSDYKICTGACRSTQTTPTDVIADDTEYM